MTHATGSAWLGYAFAYGGLGQLLAGMWEFRNRNVFGATAFSTYGGFWIGLGLWVLLVANPAVAAIKPCTLAATVTSLNHDLGWILLAFAIFNTYMLILSTQVNMAVFAVFLTLEITEIVLAIGNFNAGAAVLPTERSSSAATSACSPRSSPGTPRRPASLERHGREAQVPRGQAADQLSPDRLSAGDRAGAARSPAFSFSGVIRPASPAPDSVRRTT